MVRSRWKAPFVSYKLLDDIILNKKRSIIRTRSRSSTILNSFIGLIFEVYTGRLYKKVYIDEKIEKYIAHFTIRSSQNCW